MTKVTRAINVEWIQAHLNSSPRFTGMYSDGSLYTHKHACDRVKFANGGSLSIQASEFTYCIPRNNTGPWTHVEIGFPEGLTPEAVKVLRDFAGYEDDDVIGYAPIELVIWVAELCGGVTDETYYHAQGGCP